MVDMAGDIQPTMGIMGIRLIGTGTASPMVDSWVTEDGATVIVASHNSLLVSCPF